MTDTIGFIGLGQMGEPMAGALLQAGFGLKVFNRTAPKADALVRAGAKRAATPAEAAEPGGIVCTMVADDRALDAVTLGPDGVLARLGRGGVHLALSTVAPATARRMSELHGAQGSAYVAAPVFGRPEAAAARKLWVVLAGPQSAKTRVSPVIAALSQGRFDFGEDAALANVVKLAGNFLIAGAIEAIAEALALGEKHGVDRGEMVRMFAETLFACPIYRNYGAALAARRYTPAGFRLALGLKDVRLVLDAANDAQVPMPLASLVHDRLLGLVAGGRGDLDWSGLELATADAAGLAPSDPGAAR